MFNSLLSVRNHLVTLFFIKNMKHHISEAKRESNPGLMFRGRGLTDRATKRSPSASLALLIDVRCGDYWLLGGAGCRRSARIGRDGLRGGCGRLCPCPRCDGRVGHWCLGGGLGATTKSRLWSSSWQLRGRRWWLTTTFLAIR